MSYQPIFQSPITVTSTRAPHSPQLHVSDLSGAPILSVQGDTGEALTAYLHNLPARFGEVAVSGDLLVARTAPTELYITGLVADSTAPSANDLNTMLAEAGRFAHVTDFSGGKAVIKLSGPAAPDCLSKLCGLDFHDAVFGNLQAKQSSAAKVKTMIIRCDEADTPTYYLHVSRPLGQYFWETLLDAAGEYGVAVAA